MVLIANCLAKMNLMDRTPCKVEIEETMEMSKIIKWFNYLWQGLINMLINQTNKFVKDLGIVMDLKVQWASNVKPIDLSCMTTWWIKIHKGPKAQNSLGGRPYGDELGFWLFRSLKEVTI